MQQGVCVVQRELLEQLREITEEERRILNGEAEVDRIFTRLEAILQLTAIRCWRKGS